MMKCSRQVGIIGPVLGAANLIFGLFCALSLFSGQLFARGLADSGTAELWVKRPYTSFVGSIEVKSTKGKTNGTAYNHCTSLPTQSGLNPQEGYRMIGTVALDDTFRITRYDDGQCKGNHDDNDILHDVKKEAKGNPPQLYAAIVNWSVHNQSRVHRNLILNRPTSSTVGSVSITSGQTYPDGTAYNNTTPCINLKDQGVDKNVGTVEVMDIATIREFGGGNCEPNSELKTVYKLPLIENKKDDLKVIVQGGSGCTPDKEDNSHTFTC